MTNADKIKIYDNLESMGFFNDAAETTAEKLQAMRGVIVSADDCLDFATACGVDYSERMEEELLPKSEAVLVNGAYMRFIARSAVDAYKVRYGIRQGAYRQSRGLIAYRGIQACLTAGANYPRLFFYFFSTFFRFLGLLLNLPH